MNKYLATLRGLREALMFLWLGLDGFARPLPPRPFALMIVLAA